MAHIQQRNYLLKVKERFSQFFFGTKVVEAGSLNINGTARDFFNSSKLYVGVDVGAGPGVDIVCDFSNFEPNGEMFDVAISCEMLEHNPNWIDSFKKMIDVTRSEGLIIFTCATEGRAEHGTSRTSPSCSPLTIGIGWEYYKNLTERDFKEHFNFDTLFKEYEFSVDNIAKDLYFWGIKN